MSGIGGRTSMPNEFEGLLCAQTIDSETGGLNEHTRDVTTLPRNMSIKGCCAAFDPENDADVQAVLCARMPLEAARRCLTGDSKCRQSA